ncbi:hypothetical protein TWF281_010865 [Arthrobotrys megalospora]
MTITINEKETREHLLSNETKNLIHVKGRVPGGTRAWWKEASVYQIYPASFCDSNGDGLGDIPGIISKVDYLKNFGVDVVWLSPVVNHTSDQHAWFQESRSSKSSPLRDWYIWRPPTYDAQGNRHPPNNWASIFGGSAWEYDAVTDEYYLHLFCAEQPDLNWENPNVVSAVHDVIRFWLDKGVDGFRMDVINVISKTPGLPDAPITVESSTYQPAMVHYANGPRLHEHLRGLRAILDQYDAFSVGEMPWVRDPDDILQAVGASRKELNMIFQFDIVDMDGGPSDKFAKAPWSLQTLRDIVGKWQTCMIERDGWNALFLENHDQPRSISRFASDRPEFRIHAAKMLATFLALQSGTLFIYQGQELGMANLPKDWSLEEFKDVETINYMNDVVKVSKIKGQAFYDQALEVVRAKARDNSRSPFQWDATKNAGFSSGTPWMRVNDDYIHCNAQSQVNDPQSVFAFWQNILRLRRKVMDVFVYGDFKFLDVKDENICAYQRSHPVAGRAVVFCNFSQHPVSWIVPDEVQILCDLENLVLRSYDTAVSLQSISPGTKRGIQFRPYEAMVFFSK